MNWVTQRSKFPALRHRRKRQASWIRELVSENYLLPRNLILPVFVHGEDQSHEIGTMPGVKRLSFPDLIALAKTARSAGIPALALFPVVDASRKTEKAEEAYEKKDLELAILTLLLYLKQ